MMKKTTKNTKMAWVPVKEVKTMESEKEEEKQQQHQEEKKKIYSSIPSNYVTLAQLQERWLKQQKQQEDEEEKNDDHRPLEERHVAVVASANVTVYRSNSVDGNRDDSAINHHAIGVDGRKSITGDVIGANSQDGRKSVIGDAIGGGNEDLNGKVEESKTMKKKKNRENGWKKKKAMKAKVEKNGTIEEGSAAKENGIAEKVTMRIELKDVKDAVDEVEHEFRVLSVKSGNGKQNWKVKKGNNGAFSQSRSMRNNRNGGDCHGHGHGHGHGGSKDERSSEAQMIWVKKDNSVGGN